MRTRRWRPHGEAIVLPAASLDDYVGTYKLAEPISLLKVFRMDDGLFAR